MKKILAATCAALMLGLGLTAPAHAIVGTGLKCGSIGEPPCSSIQPDGPDDTTALSGAETEADPDPDTLTPEQADYVYDVNASPSTATFETVDNGNTVTYYENGAAIQTTPSNGGQCTIAKTVRFSYNGDDLSAEARIHGCGYTKYVDAVRYSIDRHGHKCGNNIGSWLDSYTLNGDAFGGWNPPQWKKDCVKGQGLMTKTFYPSRTYAFDTRASENQKCFGATLQAWWHGVNIGGELYNSKQVCLVV